MIQYLRSLKYCSDTKKKAVKSRLEDVVHDVEGEPKRRENAEKQPAESDTKSPNPIGDSEKAGIRCNVKKLDIMELSEEQINYLATEKLNKNHINLGICKDVQFYNAVN
ncbi:MAG: hypothetical protein ACI9CD_000891 [Candidatus Deianiraeaceae bacterium]